MSRIVKLVLALVLALSCATARAESTGDELLGKGMHAYFRGDYVRSFELLSQAINAGSKNPVIYYYRGLAQVQLGRSPDATLDFVRGAQLEATGRVDPDDISRNLARVQGRTRLTIERYRQEGANAGAAPSEQVRAMPSLPTDAPPPPSATSSSAPPPPTFAPSDPPASPPAPSEPPPAAAAPPSATETPAITPPPAVEPPAEAPASTAPPTPTAQPSETPPPTTETPSTPPPASDVFSSAPPAPSAAPPTAPSTVSSDASALESSAPPTPPAPAMTPPVGDLSATSPPPSASEPPAATSPAAAMTPEATVQAAINAVIDGKPQDLWPMLPAKYQQDIEAIVHEFGQTMDTELWDASMAAVLKTSQVLREKQDMLLASPPLTTQILFPIDQDNLTQGISGAADLLQLIATSEIATADGVATLDPQAFLSGTVAKLLDRTMTTWAAVVQDEVAGARTDLKTVTITPVQNDGQTAVLQVQRPGEEPQTVTLKLLDGHWLPAPMVDQWDERIAAMRASLGAADFSGATKTQALAALTVFDNILNQLQAAGTQEEFNAVLGNLTTLASGLGFGADAGMPQSAEPTPSVPPAMAPPLGTGPGGDSLPPTTVPPPVNPPSTAPPPAVPPMPTAPPANPFG